MLVIFPFEEVFYQEAGVPVEFVGHPLAGKVKPDQDKQTMRARLNIDDNKRVVGLLPGSRKGEIKRLLPVMLQSAETLQNSHPNLVFLIPLASSLSPKDLAPYLASTTLDIRLVENNFYNAVQLCEAAIVTSGTATLETALLTIPMMIIYKASWSTYQIVKRIIHIPYIGLCNIVAGKSIVKEFIQDAANVENLSQEVERILNDEAYRTTMVSELQQVKGKLGLPGGSEKAAKALIALL
ncbi:MAG: lpxB [Gammaproteobacteria bacterium]|nr:lpxB [Gammaproteobacteria bacterium]